LALQVRGLDEIAVDNPYAADAGPYKQIGCRRTDRAASNQHGTGGQKPFLTLLANAGKKYLARIPLV
jgi:hypothetical protein